MIDARGLHGWLGPKWQFNQWIRDRITDYGFADGEDFRAILHKTKGRPRIEYLLTIGMAKELAMVEYTYIRNRA